MLVTPWRAGPSGDEASEAVAALLPVLLLPALLLPAPTGAGRSALGSGKALGAAARAPVRVQTLVPAAMVAPLAAVVPASVAAHLAAEGLSVWSCPSSKPCAASRLGEPLEA